MKAHDWKYMQGRVFNLFTPFSLAYISNHALSFLFTFVKGYSIIAESLYFP